jgi:tripartite-type tricarboxylate transporter receptor subunit TctC
MFACFQLLACFGSAGAEESFSGQTVQIVVGFAPGGGFDSYARAISRHLGRHIPGHPVVIVNNMAGAGSMIAANFVYHQAKADGLTIGTFLGSAALSQLLGLPGIDFDARRFQWLGVPVKQDGACFLTAASGITDLKEWRAAKSPVKLATTGVNSLDFIMAKVLKNVIGLPIQIVSGYKGTAEARLAAEGGEVAGGCWQWQPLKPTWKNALTSGAVRVVLQLGPAPHHELSNVPLALSLAKNEEARLFLKVAVENPNLVTNAYALAPDTPKGRTEILRRAFLETLKDSLFLDDARKSNLDVDPLTGEETERLIGATLNIAPRWVEKLRTVVLK